MLWIICLCFDGCSCPFKYLSLPVLSTAALIFFSAIQVLKAGLSARHRSDGSKGK